MNGIIEMLFGRDKIYDWKDEYRNRELRRINELMSFEERLEDGIIKLIDCWFDIGYRVMDYFRS